jgi:hypothetical protein
MPISYSYCFGSEHSRRKKKNLRKKREIILRLEGKASGAFCVFLFGCRKIFSGHRSSKCRCFLSGRGVLRLLVGSAEHTTFTRTFFPSVSFTCLDLRSLQTHLMTFNIWVGEWRHLPSLQLRNSVIMVRLIHQKCQIT